MRLARQHQGGPDGGGVFTSFPRPSSLTLRSKPQCACADSCRCSSSHHWHRHSHQCQRHRRHNVRRTPSRFFGTHRVSKVRPTSCRPSSTHSNRCPVATIGLRGVGRNARGRSGARPSSSDSFSASGPSDQWTGEVRIANTLTVPAQGHVSRRRRSPAGVAGGRHRAGRVFETVWGTDAAARDTVASILGQEIFDEFGARCRNFLASTKSPKVRQLESSRAAGYQAESIQHRAPGRISGARRATDR
jgi:hypothetical protein